MLLLLLLAMEDENNKKRILIDALLQVESRSAASIARAAGVAPAALSNLRKENGVGQISQEGQDRVLAALGWPSGNPNPNVTFRWKVKNLAGLEAFKWLLAKKSKNGVKLIRLFAKDQQDMSAQFPVLIGKFGPNAHPISISFHALDEQVNSGFKELWNELNEADWTTSIEVPMDFYEATYRGAVAEIELNRLVDAKDETDTAHIDPEVMEQLQIFGLTKKLHHKLLLDWLVKLANVNRTDFVKKLRTLEKLNLIDSEIRPSGMTDLQLEKFVSEFLQESGEDSFR